MEEFEYSQCRTCLGVVGTETCTLITEDCVDKNIKQSIIQLVPEMESTLMDDEVVCQYCLKILHSCMKFINRCLKTEVDIQDNISKQLEALNNIECSENVIKTSINLDHDYLRKTETETLENCVAEDSDQELSEFNHFMLKEDNNKIPNGDDTGLMDSYKDYSLENEYNDATYDTSRDTVKDNIIDFDENSGQENAASYECNICKGTFPTRDELKKHKTVHNIICEICSQSFTRMRTYNSHMRIHSPFMCEKCGKTFIAENQYKRHLSVHMEREKKMCEICGKICPTSSALLYHKYTHIEEPLFMCDKCPRKYKSQFNLKRHIKQVHEKCGQQQCQKCGIVVAGRQTYAMHYRLIHLQLKPFVCDVCGREFGRKDYLQKHMYYHTGERRPIQNRNSTTTNPKSNRRGKPPKFGIRLKDPGTPVNCKICGKMIVSVHLLKAHLQSHVKIKRHKCKFCELTFTLSNNRDRHQKLHEADPEKKFRCNICWKRMKTEEELEKHIIGHYNRPPQHCCDICGEKFHRKYLLDNHHLDKHTDPEDIEKAEKEIVINNLLEYAHPLYNLK